MSEQPTAEDSARDLLADLAGIVTLRLIEDYGERREAIMDVLDDVAPAAIRRALAAEAIINAPQTALFADGREPTTNERHLLNLLSWREREAAQAKAEVVRLQRIIDGLADRVAEQSEALSRRAEVTKVVAYQPIELRLDDDGSPHRGEG